jgi:hypothetical protein|tara:strand:+ start:2563 stop:2778 length:216 start_codon:yes stop_codon:yes gene_type:complete
MHQFIDEEEYVESVLIDVQKRSVIMFSNHGDQHKVTCDTVDEFMGVLKFVRDTLEDDAAKIYYVDPKSNET